MHPNPMRFLAPLGILALVACGDATGPGAEVSAGGPWAQVAAGGAHGCAVDATGTLACWGSNGSGQLGFDGSGVWEVPHGVGGGPWQSVATGARHTCAVDVEGGVWCWGSNEQGQVDGSPGKDRPTPTRLPIQARVTQVAAGEAHSCALTQEGLIVCWGRSTEGQAGGDGRVTGPLPPTVIPGGPWTTLTAGAYHGCAVTRAGTAHCWGANGGGEVGAGVALSPRLAVSRVGGALRFRSVGAGVATACGVDDGQRVLCWGDNEAGQVAPTGPRVGSPVLRDAGPILAVAGGDRWTCALRGDGSASCWGLRWDMAEGGDAVKEPGGWTAVASDGVSLAVGRRHACVVTTTGGIVCWGDPSGGRLGPFGP